MRFLFVDKILEQIPGQLSRGIKQISPDDPFLYLDEQGRAQFIPSLIGETLGQLAAWNVMFSNGFNLRPVAGVASSATVHRPAFAGETLLLESFIDQLDDKAVQYHSQASINGEPVFTLDGAIGPLLPMEDFISQEDVIQQYHEIAANEKISIAELDYGRAIEHHPCFKFLSPNLYFDRSFAFEAGQAIQAEKRISRLAGYFPDHFPRRPVLPMTVLLECKINLAHEFIQRSDFPADYQFQSLTRIKMSDFVEPGDLISCQLKLKQQTDEELILSFRSSVNGKRVCVAEALFTVRG